MKKHLLGLILALAMLMCIGVVAASADGNTIEVTTTSSTVDIDLPDSDELFAGYVEQQFYADLYGGISTFSTGSRTAGSQLEGDAKTLYDALVPYIKSIAKGERTNTHIGFGKQITVPQNGTLTTLVPDQDLTFVGSSFTDEQFEQVVSALLVDLPYDMYWFDKTTGFSYSLIVSNSTIEHLFIEFVVASPYQSSTFATDATKTAATATAVSNANQVVTDNAGKSDYEKLLAYKEYICDNVSYNSEAASDSYTGGYGDPWQMIYVFDGKESTNVVCEGYAKAFQYLCDMTDWSGDVQCYTVTGDMAGGTGAGGHMWNMVTLNGTDYYLVDVTNSDAGSIGQNGELFMAGNSSGSPDAGYSFTIGTQTVSFEYDEDLLWANDVLTLAETSYVPVQTYTVTFADGLGTTLKTQTVEKGKAATAPTEPTREGYSFDGWDKDFSNITANITVAAKWKINQYTLTFNNDDGTLIASFTLNYGEAVTFPDDPSKTGYTFSGWNSDFPFSPSMPAQNLTFTAKWEINQYTITFNTDGGTPIAPITQDYGTEVTAPADPTRTGYAFIGWDKNIPATMPAENMTITANWEELLLTASLTGSAKVGGTLTASYANNVGTASFQWYTVDAQSNETLIQGATGSSCVIPTGTVGSTIKVIVIDSNGRTVSASSGAIGKGTPPAIVWPNWEDLNAITYGQKMSEIIIPDDDMNGSFSWPWPNEIPTVQYASNVNPAIQYTPSDEALANYDYSDIVLNRGYPIKINKAQAVINTTDVVKEYTWAGVEQVVDSGAVLNHTETTELTYSNNTITGVPEGGKQTITISAKETANYQSATATVEITISPAQYTITWVDENNQTLETETVTYGANATKTPTIPAKEGHTGAWNHDGKNITANTTIALSYTVNQYTITFITDGGTPIDPITQDYGTTVTRPGNPTKEGYTFRGWDNDFPASMPATNVTLTAQWEINQYTITFNTDGGTPIAPITQDYGTAVTSPDNPTKDGYVFAGWDKKIPATMPAENVTITATWNDELTCDECNQPIQTIGEHAAPCGMDGHYTCAEDYLAAEHSPCVHCNNPLCEGDHSLCGAHKINIDEDIVGGTLTAYLGDTELTRPVHLGEKVTINATSNDLYILDVLTVTDASGKKIDISQVGSSSYEFTMPKSDVTVTATFKEKVAEQVTLTGITITTSPTKTAYTAGENFDPTGMLVTAIYSDGTSKAVTTYTIEGGEALTTDKTSITVSYTEDGVTKTATQAISVSTASTAVTYTVAITNGTGGGEYAEGASVAITANAAAAGKQFTGWTGLEGLTITLGSSTATQLTFTMPAKDVTISAVYADIPVETFQVSFSANGGSGVMTAVSVPVGAYQLPACTFTAPEGKQFKAWDVNGAEYAPAASINMTGDTVVKAVWSAAPVIGQAPVIVEPAAAQSVSGKQNGQVTMSITATGATGYQWYVNRQDGKGYVVIEGATAASYTTSAVEPINNGYTYYCIATNATGSAQSPVFTLAVEPQVPQTGDPTNLALWFMLMLTSSVGILAMLIKSRKRNQT